MITSTAYSQLMNMIYQGKIDKNVIESITVLIACSNQLIKRFTTAGEIVLEEQ